VGRDGGIAEAVPTLQHQDAEGPSDHQLVAAVRRGDDRAFERLYHRYHRRITAYVLGMCKDHARAEDITQEIFVSALRRMRETERPIAFKPWIYEIAKNACIDQHRRARRTEEVSLQAEDGLAPADYGRLVNSDPTPDAAFVVKQELDHLCGAFGGLSEMHHEILVMRELEGLSYREIGDRLGMSRPAVESTLFRARRRLTEEYDDLVSGQRCLRIQGIIATAARGRLGTRDTSRLARHVAHCQPCRREATAAGLDAALLRTPLRTRVAAKVAALLPFPLFGRRFGGRGTDDAATGVSSGWAAHVPMISDQLGAGWGKAAAAAALLLAGVGAGVGTKVATGPAQPAARTHAAPARDQGSPAGGGGAARPAALVVPRRTASPKATAKRQKSGAAKAGARSAAGSQAGSATSTPASSSPSAAPKTTDAVKPVTTGPSTIKPPSTPAPKLQIPATAPSVGDVVSGAQDAVGDAVQGAAGTVSGAGDAVDDATQGATAPVTGAVDDATGTVAGGLGP
jgi:RNA polymerase sigma factor (sigma-70 family)